MQKEMLFDIEKFIGTWVSESGHCLKIEKVDDLHAVVSFFLNSYVTTPGVPENMKICSHRFTQIFTDSFIYLFCVFCVSCGVTKKGASRKESQEGIYRERAGTLAHVEEAFAQTVSGDGECV